MEEMFSSNESLVASFNETAANKTHLMLGAKITFAILYPTVFILAVGGNFLVIYVVATNRSMQTVTNLFITNLAISDMAVNFTSLWLTPLYTYLERWIWGYALCFILPLFQGTSVFLSSLTLMSISIDRFVVILYPFKNRMSARLSVCIILLIWIVSLMLVTPMAMHTTMIYINETDIYICTEDWPKDTNSRVIYGTMVMVLQFGVPFTVIAYCYARIWFNLRYRAAALGPRSDAELQRKRRMLKMLVSMVVIYAFCWIPWNVMNILLDQNNGELMQRTDSFEFLFVFAHLIGMTATMWNPLLYAFMNDNFQREFRSVLRCSKNGAERKRSRRSSSIATRSEKVTSKCSTDETTKSNVKFSSLLSSSNSSRSKRKAKNVNEEMLVDVGKEIERDIGGKRIDETEQFL